MSDFYPDLFQGFKQKAQGEVLYRQLFELLRQGILAGRLKGGEKLPSSRDLASQLSVSRNTVKTAYEQLIAEGYIVSRQGAGSYVANLPEQLLPKSAYDATNPAHLPELSDHAQRFMQGINLYPGGRLLLQPAIPSLDTFPRKRWRSCLSAAADLESLHSQPNAGHRGLRQQIARHLSTFRGIQVSEEQILITSGSQQGSYMIASLLTGAGDSTLLEAPGFPGTEAVIRASGADVRHIGWQALQQGYLSEAARLLFITPSRNFPLGHTLPLDARLNILHWAEENNSWVVEDDYDSEFAVGAPVTALFALSQQQRVIYTGTFSRTMYPSLRLGYMVLPELLVPLFSKARRYMDGGLSVVPQVAMAQFMANGDYSRHIKKLRSLYQQRRQYLEYLLAQSSLKDLPVIDAGGGMHLVVKLPEGFDDQSLVEHLMVEGVGLRALSYYDQTESPVSGLVFGFTLDDEENIAKGVKIVERLFLEHIQAIAL